jgi:drug/metabolite transporter (DMT)-like permease
MTSRELRANAILLVSAGIWGFAFVAQRIGMEYVGPFLFNGVRFALGCLTLVPVWYLTSRRRSGEQAAPPASGARLIGGGCLAGLALFAGSSFQQVGIVYTTAGKAGFITGLYVVLVPILGLLWKQRVGAGGWTGAALAIAGLYLLSVREGFRLDYGDLLVLISAFFWAVHVLLIGWLSRKLDVVALALIQFGVVSVLSTLVAVPFETISLAAVKQATIPILYGGIMSVGIGFTLQVVAQRHARPNVAAILLSLEAVFAALGGWMILGEVLPLRGIVGCALMFAGVVTSQLKKGDMQLSP